MFFLIITCWNLYPKVEWSQEPDNGLEKWEKICFLVCGGIMGFGIIWGFLL